MLIHQDADAQVANQFVESLQRDYRTVELSHADRVLLDFAVQLTREPELVGPSQAAGLRAAGFDDRAIHDIVCVTAYFAFVNRLAEGLGVELEG